MYYVYRLFAILILILFWSSPKIEAQVFSRIISDSTELIKIIPWQQKHQLVPVLTKHTRPITRVYLDSISAAENVHQFGAVVPASLNASDGHFYDYGSHLNFKLKLGNPSSSSIRIVFDTLSLPDSSAMFIYNEATNFVLGPVLQKNLTRNKYSTDIISGGLITIDILMPKHLENHFDISISDVVLGVEVSDEVPLSFDDAYNTSNGCAKDVECLDEWAIWRNERAANSSSFDELLADFNHIQDQESAVCKLIVGGGSCSGSLVNNECENLRPLILTAEHCITGVDPDNIVFRFNYKSNECGSVDENGDYEPSISGNRDQSGPEPLPSTWITYQGSSLIMSIVSPIDIALLELNQPLELSELIKFIGWDRSDIRPLESYVIGHPLGDTKRFSPFIEPVSRDDNMRTYRFADLSVQPGSSGSPHLNENGHVVGVLSTGTGQFCNGGGTHSSYRENSCCLGR